MNDILIFWMACSVIILIGGTIAARNHWLGFDPNNFENGYAITMMAFVGPLILLIAIVLLFLVGIPELINWIIRKK